MRDKINKTVLITGGAGFVGSHLADAYLQSGYRVRVLDNLTPQIHGFLNETRTPPDYLNPAVEFIFGDVCDRKIVQDALQGIDIVSHHAAAVGVGQSMYAIGHYTKTNTMGAATLLDVIVNDKIPISKMIVASSMSIYGEGAYLRSSTKDIVYPSLRTESQFKLQEWDMHDIKGEKLDPLPTSESKPVCPMSIYAINKRDHEEMFMLIGKAYNIPTVALRYFNIFGTRQALSNPYTGVMAIFCGRLLNDRAPVVFEDGLQRRDFIHINDVAQANILATEKSEADFEVFNIGSGRSINISEIAETLARVMGKAIRPEISRKFRVGDIRHCFADISKAKAILGFEPQYDIKSGISELIEWVKKQTAEDSFDEMRSHLERQRLVK